MARDKDRDKSSDNRAGLNNKAAAGGNKRATQSLSPNRHNKTSAGRSDSRGTSNNTTDKVGGSGDTGNGGARRRPHSPSKNKAGGSGDTGNGGNQRRPQSSSRNRVGGSGGPGTGGDQRRPLRTNREPWQRADNRLRSLDRSHRARPRERSPVAGGSGTGHGQQAANQNYNSQTDRGRAGFGGGNQDPRGLALDNNPGNFESSQARAAGTGQGYGNPAPRGGGPTYRRSKSFAGGWGAYQPVQRRSKKPYWLKKYAPRKAQDRTEYGRRGEVDQRGRLHYTEGHQRSTAEGWERMDEPKPPARGPAIATGQNSQPQTSGTYDGQMQDQHDKGAGNKRRNSRQRRARKRKLEEAAGVGVEPQESLPVNQNRESSPATAARACTPLPDAPLPLPPFPPSGQELGMAPMADLLCQFQVSKAPGNMKDTAFERKKLVSLESDKRRQAGHDKRVAQANTSNDLPRFTQRLTQAKTEGWLQPMPKSKRNSTDKGAERGMPPLTKTRDNYREAGQLAQRAVAGKWPMPTVITKDQQALAWNGVGAMRRALSATEAEGQTEVEEVPPRRTVWEGHIRSVISSDQSVAAHDLPRCAQDHQFHDDLFEGTFIDAGKWTDMSVERKYRYSMLTPCKPVLSLAGCAILDLLWGSGRETQNLSNERSIQLRRDAVKAVNIRRDTLYTLSEQYVPLQLTASDIRVMRMVVEAMINNPQTWAISMMQIGLLITQYNTQGMLAIDRVVAHALSYVGEHGALDMMPNPMCDQPGQDTLLQNLIKAVTVAKSENLSDAERVQILSIGKPVPYTALDGQTRWAIPDGDHCTRGLEHDLLVTMPGASALLAANDHKTDMYLRGGIEYRDQGMMLLTEKDLIDKSGKVHDTHAVRVVWPLMYYRMPLQIDESPIKVLGVTFVMAKAIYEAHVAKEAECKGKVNAVLRTAEQPEVQNMGNVSSPVIACPRLPSPDVVSAYLHVQCQGLVEGQLLELVYVKEMCKQTFRAYMMFILEILDTRADLPVVADTLRRLKALVDRIAIALYAPKGESIKEIEKLIYATVLIGNWSYNKLLAAKKLNHNEDPGPIYEDRSEVSAQVKGTPVTLGTLTEIPQINSIWAIKLYEPSKRDGLSVPQPNSDAENKRCARLFRAVTGMATVVYDAQHTEVPVKDEATASERALAQVDNAFTQVAKLCVPGRAITMNMCDKALAESQEESWGICEWLVRAEAPDKPESLGPWITDGRALRTAALLGHIQTTLGQDNDYVAKQSRRVWNFLSQVFTSVVRGVIWPMDLPGAIFVMICDICSPAAKVHAQMTLMWMQFHSVVDHITPTGNWATAVDLRGLIMSSKPSASNKSRPEVWPAAWLTQHSVQQLKLVSRLPCRNPLVKAVFLPPTDLETLEFRQGLAGMMLETTYNMATALYVVADKDWCNRLFKTLDTLGFAVEDFLDDIHEGGTGTSSTVKVVCCLVRVTEVLREAARYTDRVVAQYCLDTTFTGDQTPSLGHIWQTVTHMQTGQVHYDWVTPNGEPWNMAAGVSLDAWAKTLGPDGADPSECQQVWAALNRAIKDKRALMPRDALALSEYIDDKVWCGLKEVSAWTTVNIVSVLQRLGRQQKVWDFDEAKRQIDRLVECEGRDIEFEEAALRHKDKADRSDLFLTAKYLIQDRHKWVRPDLFMGHAVTSAPVFGMVVRAAPLWISRLAVANLFKEKIVSGRWSIKLCGKVVLAVMAYCRQVQLRYDLDPPTDFPRWMVIHRHKVTATLYPLRSQTDKGEQIEDLMRSLVEKRCRDGLFDTAEEVKQKDKAGKSQAQRYAALKAKEEQLGLVACTGYNTEQKAKNLRQQVLLELESGQAGCLGLGGDGEGSGDGPEADDAEDVNGGADQSVEWLGRAPSVLSQDEIPADLGGDGGTEHTPPEGDTSGPLAQVSEQEQRQVLLRSHIEAWRQGMLQRLQLVAQGAQYSNEALMEHADPEEQRQIWLLNRGLLPDGDADLTPDAHGLPPAPDQVNVTQATAMDQSEIGSRTAMTLQTGSNGGAVHRVVLLADTPLAVAQHTTSTGTEQTGTTTDMDVQETSVVDTAK